jgi:hypothetical protein
LHLGIFEQPEKIVFSTTHPNEPTRCIKTVPEVEHFKNPVGKRLKVYSTDFPLHHLV